MELWVVHAPKRVVVGAVMAMAMCVHAAPALAHSMLVKAEPPRRALLAKAPAQVRLWFNEEIETPKMIRILTMSLRFLKPMVVCCLMLVIGVPFSAEAQHFHELDKQWRAKRRRR